MAESPLDIEDPAALEAYLRATGRVGTSEAISIRTLTGGVSNKTVLVRTERTAWVLKQALPKLRVQADWFSDPARIEREALGLRWLAELAPGGAITPLVFEDAPRHLLAMQAVPKPHENWKEALLAGRIEADRVRQFAALLAQIHRAAYERRDELARLFDDRRFFESLRIEPYYTFTAARVPGAAAFLQSLIHATRARRFTLVHGDYSPKNILLHDGHLVLLDHEVIHFGDPAFDAGFALTHLLSKAHHLPAHRQRLAESAQTFWDVYRGGLGDPPWAGELQGHAVRHTLGCLLARVAGRSPLEYLSTSQRKTQQEVVVGLMAQPPGDVAELVHRFVNRLPQG